MPDYSCAGYGRAPPTFRLILECPVCGAMHDMGIHDEYPLIDFFCWCGNDTFRAVKK